ncbi:hypothetical protein E2C01_069346 [Portunus trituberculatus]|uniref:Uncharacterized protein n=1 Tax=Portunus trituberculatus TaxID=210409 RepID=A0A5B7HYA7_PORTR|nr:hypothetical protein [Portunus trituberculatus]
MAPLRHYVHHHHHHHHRLVVVSGAPTTPLAAPPRFLASTQEVPFANVTPAPPMAGQGREERGSLEGADTHERLPHSLAMSRQRELGGGASRPPGEVVWHLLRREAERVPLQRLGP